MSAILGMMFINGGSGGLPPVTPSVGIAFGGGQPAKRLTVYNWSSASGFGSIFSVPSIANSVNQVSFVRDNSNLSVSFAVAPYFNVWQWSGLGFGTQYSNPSSALNPSTGGPAGFAWTNNVDAILTSNTGSPSQPQAWAWSRSSGFGTKYSNGASLNTGGTESSISLNGSNTQVAFGQNGSPFISVMPWSTATGFGSKYSDPTTLSNSGPNRGGLSFNAVTNDVAYGATKTPFIHSYAVTSSGIGTKYSNPATAVGGTVYGVRFSPNGASLAISNNAVPGIKVYRWGGGFGSIYTNPSFNFGSIALDWSSTGTEVVAAQNGVAPYSRAWAWTSSGFGAAYSDPSTPPGVPVSVSFSNQ